MARNSTSAPKPIQSHEQAVAELARFADLAAENMRHYAELAAAVAELKAAAAAVMMPIVAEQKAIEKRVKPWWTANREQMTDGKRRSIELSGCVLGNRLGTPKVTFAGGTDEEAAATLQAAELDELLRIERSLDKPSILKALGNAGEADEGHNMAARLRALGFGIDQKDAFFLEAAPAPAPVSA